jgi:hypothetical protein
MDRHATTRRLKILAGRAGIQISRMHPHMLRHTFVTTMLDVGVSLRDVQIAARHADPRTTMRYDRARKNLDRHPNYILAAFMASGPLPLTRGTAGLSASARFEGRAAAHRPPGLSSKLGIRLRDRACDVGEHNLSGSASNQVRSANESTLPPSCDCSASRESEGCQAR